MLPNNDLPDISSTALDDFTMKVIIIGGGLAGLTAAIAMRRAGHSVKVSGVVSALPITLTNMKDLREIFILQRGRRCNNQRGRPDEDTRVPRSQLQACQSLHRAQVQCCRGRGSFHDPPLKPPGQRSKIWRPLLHCASCRPPCRTARTCYR